MSAVEFDWLTEAELAVVTALSQDIVSSREVVEPVGPRILKQSIMGFKAALLKQLEADIRQSLPPGTAPSNNVIVSR